MPCPYLPGRTERKVFTELVGTDAAKLNDALNQIGFRRSQSVAYRPGCVGCDACVSVRVCVNGFQPGHSQKRNRSRNGDLIATAIRPKASIEQYMLLQAYLFSRHRGGDMAAMSEQDFAGMVEQTPVDSYVIEYREPTGDSSHAGDSASGRLVGCCLTDQHGDGLSMVYSFYDANHPFRKGLGTYIILDHIARAAKLGLAYVYLGYWIENSRQMAYKARFRPIEKLGSEGWSRDDTDLSHVTMFQDKACRDKNCSDAVTPDDMSCSCSTSCDSCAISTMASAREAEHVNRSNN